MKRIAGVLFLFWTGAILVMYYVVQKPGLINALTGLLETLWTLLTAIILLFNAFGIGRRVLHLLRYGTEDLIDQLLLSWGIGLGVLGLLGLLFSAIQLADEIILSTVQIALAIFFLFRNDQAKLRTGISSLVSKLNHAFSQYPLLTKPALLLPLIFSFLLTLVPPFEAFDALLYHLSLPAEILQNGGLHPAENVAYWFPSLTENVYLWGLGMGSERAAQVVHFVWGLLAALFLWHWSTTIWGIEIGRKTLLLISAIPSLPMLASWAYADMALVYYAVAALYAAAKYKVIKTFPWLIIMGAMAGFAMGIKYTSFTVPLTCGLLLLLGLQSRQAITSAAQFSSIALATASPWYVRNAIFMGNPFYPFIFGGRYWDDFLAGWYAESGTGIGWEPLKLIMLPLETVLGFQDATFFDGRMGPLFLILAPVTVWILANRTRRESGEDVSLLTIGIYSLLSFAAWTLGVINSSALWQARLLFPALILFAIPTALAWDSLKQFDIPRLRISFLAGVMIAAVIALTVFDLGLFVLQRNPLAVAIGAQSRERYIERINPSYAALISVMDMLPADARVYSLFEPRTYGLPRQTRSDSIVSNFAHDVFIHQTADAILRHWKEEQFTHLLVYERGLEFMVDSEQDRFPNESQNLLNEMLRQLTLVAQTPDDVYSLYKIP